MITVFIIWMKIKKCGTAKSKHSPEILNLLTGIAKAQALWPCSPCSHVHNIQRQKGKTGERYCSVTKVMKRAFPRVSLYLSPTRLRDNRVTLLEGRCLFLAFFVKGARAHWRVNKSISQSKKIQTGARMAGRQRARK